MPIACLWSFSYHGVLGIRLLIMHLADLLLCGSVDLTQNTEPLTAGTERRGKGDKAAYERNIVHKWIASPTKLLQRNKVSSPVSLFLD